MIKKQDITELQHKLIQLTFCDWFKLKDRSGVAFGIGQFRWAEIFARYLITNIHSIIQGAAISYSAVLSLLWLSIRDPLP